MRKIQALIIAMFLLCAYPLSAQVGLKVGINISTLKQKGADAGESTLKSATLLLSLISGTTSDWSILPSLSSG